MKNRSGFTLIEILVVLGILGMTIPAFLSVSAYTRNVRLEAHLRSGAVFLAERESEKLIADAAKVQAELGAANPYTSAWTTDSPYEWQYRLLHHSTGDFAGLTEIAISVRWTYAGKARSLEVATYAR